MRKGKTRKTITVSVPPDMLLVIRRRVSVGRFWSISDYFRHVVTRDIERVLNGQEPVERRPRGEWRDEGIHWLDIKRN